MPMNLNLNLNFSFRIFSSSFRHSFSQRGLVSKASNPPEWMEHLVCPISKEALTYDPIKQEVHCNEIHVAYPIRNQIPILIPSEGRIRQQDEMRSPIPTEPDNH